MLAVVLTLELEMRQQFLCRTLGMKKTKGNPACVPRTLRWVVRYR